MFTAVCPVPRLHLEFLLCPLNLSLGEDSLTAQAVAPNPLHCNGPLPCDSPRGHVSLPLLIFFFFTEQLNRYISGLYYEFSIGWDTTTLCSKSSQSVDKRDGQYRHKK